MAEPKSKKTKRVIPLRSSGDPVNSQTTRPSQILFGEVKRLQEEQDELQNDLPSTLENKLPSTFSDNSRPQGKIITVQNNESLPSTLRENSRPQIENKPSTVFEVDVLPSTDEEMPSTKTDEKQSVDVLTASEEKTLVHSKSLKPSTKGDRHNKFLARYDNRIAPDIKQKIDMFCAEFSLNQREFAEQSAVHFIEVWTAKLKKHVDGKTAHDEGLKMMMWKSNPLIINLYRAYNPENKWRFKDDEAAFSYNETDLRLIELGIIETQFNSGFKKINSFSYYQNEIDQFVGQKLSEEMLTFLLGHYREKWTGKTGKVVNI